MKAAMAILLMMSLVVSARGAETQSGVLLLPFAPIGEAAKVNWIGQAVQQNLLAELSRSRHVQPIVSEAQPAVLDLAGAKDAGQAAGAAFVIFGTYHMGEAELRLLGQVLDVSSSQLIGGLKATGTLRDLFALEDAIAEQARRIFARRIDETTPAPPPPPETPTTLTEKADLVHDEMPWERDADWIERTRLHALYDDAYERSRYWYRYGIGPGPIYGGPYIPWGSWGYRYRSVPYSRMSGIYVFPRGMIRWGW